MLPVLPRELVCRIFVEAKLTEAATRIQAAYRGHADKVRITIVCAVASCVVAERARDLLAYHRVRSRCLVGHMRYAFSFADYMTTPMRDWPVMTLV